MTCDSQDRLIELNALFKECDVTIAKLQQHLKEQLSRTILPNDLATALCYCQDRVTIFRFLVEANFDSEMAFQRLYDTTHWRMNNHVDQLSWQSLPEWFEKGFAFYHKCDRWGQPVLVIRLRHFPVDFIQQQQQQMQEKKDRNDNKAAALTYSLQPFVCYMLEIARRLTYDETCRKERQQQQQHQDGYPDTLDSDGPMLLPLVIKVNVVIDMIDAPYIPIDASLVGVLSHLVQVRFPFMIGTISVLNFSWLHQGLWQVLKRLLSDDTKDRITFVTPDHLLQSIPKENLLQELGGSDDYMWNIQPNKVLQKFDTMLQYDMLPPSPPSSTTAEPPEMALNDDTDDTTGVDDDALRNKVEEEHDMMKTISSEMDEADAKKNSLGHFGVAMQRQQLGLRMGYPFLSSYLLDQLASFDNNNNNNNNMLGKEYEANQVLLTSLTENTHHGTTMEGSTQTDVIPEAISGDERQLSFFALFNKSLCWLILYIVLRIPLESLIYRQLMTLMHPQHLLTATIGITAGMAMVVGTFVQVVDI